MTAVSRILMTTDTVGGVWNFTVSLCSVLARQGVRILVAAFGPRPSDGQWSAIRDLQGVDLAWRELKLCWMQEPWDDVEAARDWLGELEASFEPDVVHVNTLGHANRTWSAPLLTVGHSCVFSWFRAVHGHDPGPEWARYRREVGAGLRRSDLVVAPSRAMLAELRRFYGPFRSDASIHNGLSKGRDVDDTKMPLILAAGRAWDEAKNVAALARVAERLPWRVAVAGEHDHPDGGAAVFEGVSMLGRLEPEELDRWYDRAAIFAHPAKYEPFGLTPLEAGRAGCALVLGDIPTFRELWDGAAVFVDPNDDDALAAALTELIGNGEALDDLRTRARCRANKLPLSTTAHRYRAAYETLVGRPRASQPQGVVTP